MTSRVRDGVVRVLGTALLGGLCLAVLVSCSATTSSPPVVPKTSPRAAQSYIVEALNSEVAARAVLAAGGEVNSRLNIIDAVEAKLTDTQRALVSAAPGIKQISINTLVSTQAAAYVK